MLKVPINGILNSFIFLKRYDYLVKNIIIFIEDKVHSMLLKNGSKIEKNGEKKERIDSVIQVYLLVRECLNYFVFLSKGNLNIFKTHESAA